MNALQKISDFFMTPAMKIVLIVAAVLFPFVAGTEYQIYVMALAFVWAIAVYGMNIITGLCGQSVIPALPDVNYFEQAPVNRHHK